MLLSVIIIPPTKWDQEWHWVTVVCVRLNDISRLGFVKKKRTHTYNALVDVISQMNVPGIRKIARPVKLLCITKHKYPTCQTFYISQKEMHAFGDWGCKKQKH